MILAHRFFELFRDNPVLVALYRHQRCLIQPHTLHVAQKRRVLHQNHVAGVNQCLAEQIHRLRGAGDGQHRRHGAPKLLLHIGVQAFQQRRIPLCRAILQDALAVLLQHVAGDFGAFRIGQRRCRRIAAREGNHAGLGNHLEDFANGAAADLVEAVRETQGIKRHNPITPYYFQRIRIKNTFSGQNPGKVTKCHGTTSVWLQTALKEEQSFLARCNRRTGCRLPAAQTRFQRMARSCTSPYAPPASSHRPEALCLRRRSG